MSDVTQEMPDWVDKKVGFDVELAEVLRADAVVPDAQGRVAYVEHKDVILNMV